MKDLINAPKDLDEALLEDVSAGMQGTAKAVSDLASYRGGGGGAIGLHAELRFQPVKAEPGEELDPYTGGLVLN